MERPLYVDVRGLTTRRLHHHGTTFEIGFDFVDHALVVQTSDGRESSFELADGVPVAEFDARLHETLAELGVDVEIREQPFGVPMTTPFPLDLEHASWDRAAIERFGHVLDWSDSVLEEFSGWFSGKISPVHLFWHSLDLAVTRFSGRRAPPIEADPVTQEAYSQEVISFGFWAGDDTVGDAAYYSYTAPEPEGLRDQPLAVGEWIEFGDGSLALLPYDAVRTAREPRATLLAFLQSAYETGARLAGWDTDSFESNWCPTPSNSKTSKPPRHPSSAVRDLAARQNRRDLRRSVALDMGATRTRIGFVGLGNMGGNMAERLLAAGYPSLGGSAAANTRSI